MARQLKAVNWDFPQVDEQSTRAIHWYPGTFPAQLPGAIIEALSQENDTVFDPYGGIGTSAVEAIRLGRKAWSVDINPLAHLAAYILAGLVLLKAKDHLHVTPIFEIERLLGITAIQSDLFSKKTGTEIDSYLGDLMRPRPEEFLAIITRDTPRWNLLQPWFEPSTLRNAKALYKRISEMEGSYFGKLLGFLMLSSSLRPSSSQIRSWGHIADNVLPSALEKKDVSYFCQNWLYRTQGNISRAHVKTLSKSQSKEVRFWASLHNWRTTEKLTFRPRGKCALLVTSPPYANAIDYTRAQRLSLYLFGYTDLNISSIGAQEIGARRKRFSAGSEANWGNELALSISTQLDFLDLEGAVALILPHADHGREQGSALINDVLIDRGWKKAFEVDRSIRQGRARQSWTSIKKETIEIFDREE